MPRPPSEVSLKMSKVKAVQQLTPEQQKAVQKFISQKPNWDGKPPDLPTCVLPSDYFAFSQEPFPKLVHDVSWIWNQTNCKISVTTECGGELILQKLNARKRRGYPKAPSYKVWQYTYEKEPEPKLYALWCEKGADDTSGSDTTPERRLVMETGVLFPSEPVVNIPSLQQVKEFNRQEAQLKKRNRIEPQISPPSKYRKEIHIQDNMNDMNNMNSPTYTNTVSSQSSMGLPILPNSNSHVTVPTSSTSIYAPISTSPPVTISSPVAIAPLGVSQPPVNPTQFTYYQTEQYMPNYQSTWQTRTQSPPTIRFAPMANPQTYKFVSKSEP